jgi:hypothetical protein
MLQEVLGKKLNSRPMSKCFSYKMNILHQFFKTYFLLILLVFNSFNFHLNTNHSDEKKNM